MGPSDATGEGEEPSGPAERSYRTVTPAYFGRRDREMDVIGWAYFLGILVLLVPLLPFVVVLWLGEKVATVLRGRESSRRE